MSVEVLVSADDLTEMVDQVWLSYLDPEGIDPLVANGDEKQPTEVHAMVSITGSWHGHLVYASSTAAARKAAAGFLAMTVDEVGEEDVTDVLGELANIVGGNVKAMLPDGCFLSLPTVIMAPESASHHPSAHRISGLYGQWAGEPVSISMWQSVKPEAGK